MHAQTFDFFEPIVDAVVSSQNRTGIGYDNNSPSSPLNSNCVVSHSLFVKMFLLGQSHGSMSCS